MTLVVVVPSRRDKISVQRRGHFSRTIKQSVIKSRLANLNSYSSYIVNN